MLSGSLGGGSGGQTWPLGTMVSIPAVSLSQPSWLSHTHQSQWQASRTPHTHTHTHTHTHSHYNDQGCYLYSNEGWSESQADTSGSSRGPRGEIQPQSPLYHYSKIGWRWRRGKYDSVCECVRADGGRRKENAARMIYARAELAHAFICVFSFFFLSCERVGVCAVKLAAVVRWTSFYLLFTQEEEGVCVCVCVCVFERSDKQERVGDRPPWSQRHCLSTGIQSTAITRSPSLQSQIVVLFLLCSLRPFFFSLFFSLPLHHHHHHRPPPS